MQGIAPSTLYARPRPTTTPTTQTMAEASTLVPIDAFPSDGNVASLPATNGALSPRAADSIPVLLTACETAVALGRNENATDGLDGLSYGLLVRLDQHSLVDDILRNRPDDRPVACALVDDYAAMWTALDNDIWASTAVKRALALQATVLDNNVWPPDVENIVDIYASLVGTPAARFAAYTIIGQASDIGVGLARLVADIGALYRRRTRGWIARITTTAPSAAAASIGRTLGDWPRGADPRCGHSRQEVGTHTSEPVYIVLVESGAEGIAAHVAAVTRDGTNARLVMSRDLERATNINQPALAPVVLPYAAALPNLLSTLVYDTDKDDAITALEAAMVQVPSWADLPPALLRAMSPLTHGYLTDFGAPTDVRAVWLDACTLALVLAQHRGGEIVARASPVFALRIPTTESTGGEGGLADGNERGNGPKRPRIYRDQVGTAIWPPEGDDRDDLALLPAQPTRRPVASLLNIAQAAILATPNARFDLASLPGELADPLALDLWRRTCAPETAERDDEGRLRGSDRLLDVASFWGVAPNGAERARPDLLCTSLAPTALAYAVERVGQQRRQQQQMPYLVDVATVPLFGRPDVGEQEREAWERACASTFGDQSEHANDEQRQQDDEAAMTPADAVLRAYGEITTDDDGDRESDENGVLLGRREWTTDHANSIVALVSAAETLAQRERLFGPSISDKARLALLAMRYGAPIEPDDLATFGGACAALAPVAALAP